jgi:predicted TIM-barrel fold metal-dependent hydrolase
MAFIDSHAHLPLRPGAREALLTTMDRLGIGRTIVVAGGSVTPEKLSAQIALGGGTDVDIDNLALADACAPSGGRLVPFFFANPHRGAAAYRQQGSAFAGLKLGPAVHGIALSDPRTESLVQTARDLGHPVYLHCLARPGFTVDDLLPLAGRYPSVTFLLGHAGVGNCDLYAVQRIQPHRNIWLETSGGFTCVIEAAIRQLGADRVIFGSEYPLQNPRAEIEKAKCLAIDDSAFAALMGGNCRRLLGGEVARG